MAHPYGIYIILQKSQDLSHFLLIYIVKQAIDSMMYFVLK